MKKHSELLVGVGVVLVLCLSLVECQVSDGDSSSSYYDPAVLQFLTQVAYSKVSNLTTGIVNSGIASNAKFCIKDPDAEWNRTFDFSSNLSFVSSCIQKTKGDMSRRICTSAEINFYFSDSLDSGFGNTNYLRPNVNCNLTSWVSGCEPGWACSVSPSADVEFNNSKDIPARTLDCQSCCEGFFCPHGITCMIPCPLGSYCPLATLNLSTGECEPYKYQLPPGQPEHTCGGANIWADISSSREVFCSPGSYCPTNIQKLPCSSGHYCRTGSVSERTCFKLSSCNSHTENQNIHAYGVLLIVSLVTLLLIIYNCSDQVLTTRERMLAKTREAAARSVREKALAREKWKSAKDAAKKHVRQLSQTFSRKKFARPLDQFNKSNGTKHGIDEDLYPSMLPSTSTSFEMSDAPGGKNTEQGDVIKHMQPIEDDPDSFDGYSFEVEDNVKRKIKNTEQGDVIKHMQPIEDDPDSFDGYSFEVEDNVKRKIPKDKQINTKSQIFKYAYAQLEKEKALQQKNQNLTFSGVITMATNPEVRKRPTIEVSFRGLTITLKGKNKHLLRCVTGKILPGRVTAVMGPSGAGKTTFLSALAGKTHGCKISGVILVNGVNESIHSYRKIIGFVPQDDIVHGNLTVEENLWFNARCRLAADLRKPEKVLIVERVIESLGLQSVRNSLVGTVEKRGISGGQRKRVNVGLELVMEPSLLILDEPTSGLDSTSSQLLLRALRREALEGVNICMVVHQPSYTLFNMFNDLIILAKGGLTVYHGSVKQVEEYFTGLGINVPDRVNPPDHFIDVLEGIVKPSLNSNISHAELPVRWMLHKGYPIPPDMRHSSAGVAILSPGNGMVNHLGLSSDDDIREQSFAGEIWQDMMCNIELRRDIIRHNFLRSRDLSKRRTPSLLVQYRYFLGRLGKQRLREARIIAIDYLILLLAGACLGSLTKVSDNNFGAPGYTYTIIAVSLLCKIAALRSFSLDKLQYWRESASGISSLAHFLAKDSVDHFNTVIKPVVYLSMFYFFSNPRSSFTDNYVVLMCLVYCVTGIGYVLAIFLEPGPSQLCAVLMPVVLTLIATQTVGNKFAKMFSNICYPKWALEAFVISNAERFSGVWLITRCGVLNTLGYDLRDWGRCIGYLILAGVVSRVVAFAGMITFQKK